MQVKLAIGLTSTGASEDGRQRIIDYLSERGIELTSGGGATLSFRGTAQDVDAVFSARLGDQMPFPRPSMTIGASGPPADPEVTIPDDLQDLVDFVSIPPPLRSF